MFLKKITISLLAVWGLLAGFTLPNAVAVEYFVHPINGSDANPGSKDAPWKTVEYALSRKSPVTSGDTVLLRGGDYYETNIAFKKNELKETAEKIALKNYQGEKPNFFGHDPSYFVVPNREWEMHDAAKNIYRSRRTWPTPPTGMYETDGKYFGLIYYKEYNWLSSDTHYNDDVNGYYAGPGFSYNPDDKKVYIRLFYPRDDISKTKIPLTHALDPNHVPISLSADFFMSFNNVTNLEVSGLSLFGFGPQAFQCHVGVKQLALKSLKVDSANVAMRLAGRGLLVSGLHYDGHIAPYISFNDMKSGRVVALPVHNADAVQILADTTDVEIAHCRIVDAANGIRLSGTEIGPSRDIRIHHNLLLHVRDDGIKIANAVRDVNIHHNRFLGASRSISRTYGGVYREDHPVGPVYIHHNLFESGLQFQTRRHVDGTQPIYSYSSVFATHGVSEGNLAMPWKLYHNTIIGGGPVFLDQSIGYEYTGHHETLYNPDAPAEYNRAKAHEVLNNVILVKGDALLGKTARVNTGQEIYDGNIYWRTQPNSPPKPYASPRYWVIDTSKGHKHFKTLAEFKADDWFKATQEYYPPGWENSSRETDPQLGADYVPIPGGPAATRGVTLPAHWPDSDAVEYRGALPPANPIK